MYPSNVLTSSVASIGLSDHCPVIVVKKKDSFAKTNMHKNIHYHDFKNFDECQFTEQLTNAPRSLINMTDNVDVKLDLFKQLYISVLNEHAPIVERHVKTIKQPPCFNAELARLIMARDHLFDRTKHSNDPRASAMYKTAKNHVNHEIRKAKCDFYIKSLE